jgi:hypothetical protein
VGLHPSSADKPDCLLRIRSYKHVLGVGVRAYLNLITIGVIECDIPMWKHFHAGGRAQLVDMAMPLRSRRPEAATGGNCV